MVEINLNKLDSETVEKYNEFVQSVYGLLENYEKIDFNRLEMVKDKIEKTDENWDKGIVLKNEKSQIVPISTLLAYEYCLATEKCTGGKVKFEDMLEKLFSEVSKFRIGNPVPGDDNESLYGRSLDDASAIPVTTKLYRIVMHAGAQHLDYFKNEEPTGAVFIYEKE